MSIFSKLFGGSKEKEPEGPKREDTVKFEGYLIAAAPERAENGQWRMAGYIIKPMGDKHSSGSDADAEENVSVDLERYFIRADVFSTREEAVEFSVKKAQQIIEQQSQRIFADGKESGRV